MSGRKASRGAPAAPPAPRLPAAATLTHWLVLVCGLALLSAVRIEELDRMAPLWMGSVLGTAIGQLLAYRRMRMWLFAFIAGNLLWVGPLTIAPLWPLLGAQPWAAAEVFVMAFAPAAFCGYLSLSERGALVAFWFPAVPWMVALLDSSTTMALGGPESWLLLGVLAVMFLGLLRARESRRIALWQGYAVTRLARPLGEVVLRQAPLRRAGQLGWMAAVGVVTLGLTGFIAPRLWQHDDLEEKLALGGKAGGALLGGAADEDWTCCPDTSATKVQKKKVKEYLPLHRTHDEEVADLPPAQCIACVGGFPVHTAKAPVMTPDPHAPVTGSTAVPSAPGGPPTTTAQPQAPASAAPIAAAPSAAPVAPSAPRASSPETPAGRPARLGRTPAASSAAIIVPSGTRLDALAWGLALALSFTVVQQVTRPLRRLLVLRHLERPIWPETVDQRVSNLWQMMLVGLRDAGFQTAPGEQPQELARRIGIEGMKTCATVLERARHGVRVDGADLEAMESAARAVYHAARGKIGVAARAASWLRWPLV